MSPARRPTDHRRMRTRTSGSDRGFTLVEVLVVTVVLGVLAAIAVPTLVGQKAKAYKAAMRADLRMVVNAQATLATDGAGPTTDVAVLEDHGYRRSDGVTVPHVVATGSSYVACVSHDALSTWLTYDASTGEYTEEPAACA
jgi:type IV pilus assembly protein PilA